jgi:hypothetical protein
MARTRKSETNETNETQDVNVTPETFEEEEEFLLPGEKPFIPNPNQESENNEMTETQETANVEVAENANVPTDALNLSDEAQRILNDAKTESLPMLDIDSIPDDAIALKFGLMGVSAMAEQISKLIKVYEVATSGKDEKVAHAIETLEHGTENFKLREKVLSDKKRLAELEALIEENELKLYSNVEAELAAKGEAVWTDEKIAEESKAIVEKWSAYKKMYDGAREGIVSHNTHTSGEKLGDVSQYVSYLEKPFGRKVGSSDGARSPHVASADYSFDKGQSWERATNGKSGDEMKSNPHFLASELARVSKDSANVIREKLFAAWYAESNQTPDSLDTSKVADISTFDITLPMKPDGVLKTVTVRIAKRGVNVEI